MKKALKIILLILLLLILLIACGFGYLYRHGMSGMVSISQPGAGQTRVACVGDSITYGHGITGWPDNTYPAVLQTLLGEGYHVNNYGVSSFAVQLHADRSYRTLSQYQDSLDYQADILVFMMGSNDSKPINWQDAKTFRADLISLLDSYSPARVLLCTPATAFFLDGQTEGTTNHNIQPLVVDEIAQIIRQVAEDRGYPLIDIHRLTALHPEWFEKDGVHPNNDGAAAIAREISTAILQLSET